MGARGFYQRTPLHTAAFYGRTEVSKALLKAGAEEDIFIAAGLGDVSTAARLLEKSPELVGVFDSLGQTPLYWAARQGHADVVELLLAKGADPSAAMSCKDTPLHAAAEMGHRDVAEMLLEHGAQVNATSSGDDTPLHRAAKRGDAEMVRLLLKWGADAAARGDGESVFSTTPRDRALRHGHDEVARMLRSATAGRDGAKE